MAHERVRYYDVKASVREVKATRIACPELDTICEAFLPGKTPRRFRQAGTEINADDPAGKTRSTSNRPATPVPQPISSTVRATSMCMTSHIPAASSRKLDVWPALQVA